MTENLPPAVVVGVGSVNGLAVIRSLGRMAVRVIAVGDSERNIGFRSRYAEQLLAPSARTDESGFIAALAKLGQSLPAPAPIFPTSDATLRAISRGRGELGENFLYPIPDAETVERVQNKAVQLAAAAAAGTPTPRTASEPTAEFGFPVLVKPALPIEFRFQFRQQAFLCHNEAELQSAYERTLPFQPLVQEWIPGGDNQLYQFGAYLDRDGMPLGVFGCRKLRQTRAGIGTCRAGESVWSEELAGLSLALAAELGLRRTFLEVELKRDERDGQLKLIELHARLWQWHGLAMACGVDFPRIAYEDLTGRSPAPRPIYRGSRRWAVTVLVGSGVGRGDHLLRPSPAGFRYVDGVFARDDLRPALFQAQEVGRLLRARLKRSRILAPSRSEA